MIGENAARCFCVMNDFLRTFLCGGSTVGRCLRDVLYISDALLHFHKKARVSIDTGICMVFVYRDFSCAFIVIENAFPAFGLE